MRISFKMYIQFEEQYGTQKGLVCVQQIFIKYEDKQYNKDNKIF